jgi:hypothetical protein
VDRKLGAGDRLYVNELAERSHGTLLDKIGTGDRLTPYRPMPGSDAAGGTVISIDWRSE